MGEWDRDEVRVEAIKRGLNQERLDDAHIVVARYLGARP